MPLSRLLLSQLMVSWARRLFYFYIALLTDFLVLGVGIRYGDVSR